MMSATPSATPVLLRQLPNTLSVMRLILAPVAAWLILHSRHGEALAVFAVAGLSDAADGYLAKNFGLASRFGAILDPLADKLLMLASFLSLTWIGQVPDRLAAVVIGRDVIIVLGVLLARAMALPLVIKPLLVGKLSTVVQVLYIAMVLLLLVLHNPAPLLKDAGVVLVALLAVWSLLAYARVWLQATRRPPPEQDPAV